jgi:hypothetical protein
LGIANHSFEADDRVNVELLYWNGCPSVEEARVLLDDVLAELRITDTVAETKVVTHDDAVALRFPGSPTIRIDGVDVDSAGAELPASLSCRVYHFADGRVSPVPSRRQLKEALRGARNG